MSTATQPTVPAAPRPTWSARIFSLPVLMGLGLMALLVFLSCPGGGPCATVADPDIWWHLRYARHLVETGHFSRADSWTFTVAGVPKVNFEWAAEVPYYFAWRCHGDLGLYLATMLTVGAIVLGIYWLGWMRSGSWKAAFAASVAAALMATVSLGPRTLLFGWLFLAIELAVLWSFAKGRDCSLLLPPLFLVWVNTHGSWFIGFVLMAVFFACGWFEFTWGELYCVRWTARQKRMILAVTAASAAALFVNPWGWRMVVYPLNMAFRQQAIIGHVAEWASLDFHGARGKFVLATFLLLGILQLIRPRRWNLQDLAFALIGIYGALSYTRFLFLAGILLAPLLAVSLSRMRGDPRIPSRGERWVNAAGMAALLAFIVWHAPAEQQLQAGVARTYPQRAIPLVRSLAGRGNLFADIGWAGYFEWNAPQVKEFADTREDIFLRRGVLGDYIRATQMRDTFAILNKYRIQYVLLEEKDPVTYLLEHSAGWKTTYDDGEAVMFERVP
ncbi:MAG TPA: hypothetical protein VME18_13735 [Acidobacteriaceae bacterium]|nr:hypothetical protein [Acidobacteriaceae bacterium]